jgi:hypothetical protein
MYDDVTFIGTKFTCPTCKLGCSFCRTRSVEVFQFQVDLVHNTTTEPVFHWVSSCQALRWKYSAP